MKTFNGLPIYKMTIDENDAISGVEFISLVDQPAIEVNWVAMNDTKRKVKFNEDQQIITGPAMIPDLPIYRFDEQLGEYYVVFTVDACKQIMRKFLKEGRTLGFNYMHQDNSQVATAQLDELWYIKDKNNDFSKTLGFDLPVGTPMVTTYIADKEFWNKEVKSGNVRGFSIEGYLNLEMNKINKNKTNTTMTKIKMEAEIKTVDGVILYTPGDSFIVDAEVYNVDENGNQTPVVDGDIVLENGSTITVKDGKITAVTEPVAQSSESTETKLAITPEDMQSIMDAIQPLIAKLEERIVALETANTTMKAENEEIVKANTEMAKANEELKTLMSKIPGATTTTTVTETKLAQTKQSFANKVDAIEAIRNARKK